MRSASFRVTGFELEPVILLQATTNKPFGSLSPALPSDVVAKDKAFLGCRVRR